MNKILLALCLAATVHAFGQRTKTTPLNPVARFSQTITPQALKEKLSVIAGAGMEGRFTTSAGQKRAAAYIEDHFRKLGLQPGYNGSYQMQFPVLQDTLLSCELTVNGKRQKIDEDFTVDIASLFNGNINIRQVVFAAYGIKDSLRNDYATVDVKGKWVLVYGGPPPGIANSRAYSNRMKAAKAKELGAAGIFILSEDFPKKSKSDTKGGLYLKKGEATSIPLISVSDALAHSILGLDPKSLLETLKNRPLGDYESKTLLVVDKRSLLLQSSNVIGILPGGEKRDEYLFVTGHYDHLGKKDSVVYYGADDDGSGTTSVLQIAEAYAKARAEGYVPRRSIVFMTVSGEEEGLLGSEYYSEHPVVPAEKTTADLNIDMVGRIDPTYKGDSLNYIYVIGDDKLSSDLRPITDSVNNAGQPPLQIDRRFNDLNDPNRFYYRSDHYNFAKKGIPVLFYFNGTHADYHRPTDTVEKINFELMAKRVKLVFNTSWAIANHPRLLKRDILLQ